MSLTWAPAGFSSPAGALTACQAEQTTLGFGDDSPPLEDPLRLALSRGGSPACVFRPS
jgi:hypothetical protein